MKFRNNIPNLITMLNLACGSIAIIQVFSGEIVLASWFIIIAAILDFMDGLAARLLHAKSSIGAQLDSLADIVSFGLAPALIMYQLILGSKLHEPVIFEDIPLLAYVSLLITVAGAYRLARFNTDPGQSGEFKGLPIPANGLFVASLPLLIHYPFGVGSEMIINSIRKDYILVVLVILLSLLMVSSIRMFSLKFHNLKWKENAYQFTLIASLPVLVFFSGFAAIPLTIILYIIFSGIRNMSRH